MQRSSRDKSRARDSFTGSDMISSGCTAWIGEADQTQQTNASKTRFTDLISAFYSASALASSSFRLDNDIALCDIDAWGRSDLRRPQSVNGSSFRRKFGNVSARNSMP